MSKGFKFIGSLYWKNKACAQMKCVPKFIRVMATLGGNYVLVRESNLLQQIFILVIILKLPVNLFINLAKFWKEVQ